jgi:hypothetical protein
MLLAALLNTFLVKALISGKQEAEFCSFLSLQSINFCIILRLAFSERGTNGDPCSN